MINGYMGEILKIDLRNKKIQKESLEIEDMRKFIGGSGLGAKYLFDLTKKDTDPLSEDNVLIFMTGPLTGTKAFSSDRFEVITKSPLTGIYAESSCGGKWGSMLKKSGYDGIIISGKSKDPVYIWINKKEVKILNAGGLWGLDTFETSIRLRKKVATDCEVACIGPAGEKLVKYATISTCEEDSRVAARAGVGTVMGSKRLKAIVVSGNENFRIHNLEGLSKFIKDNAKKIASSGVAKVLREFGTNIVVEGAEPIGQLPIKNFKQRGLKDVENICANKTNEEILKKRFYCRGCLVGCGRIIGINDGEFKTNGLIGGAEYETIGMLGSNLMVTDIKAVSKFNELCNRYGIDTITTGSVIGMVMECYERGLINKDNLDGIDLKWGDTKAIIEVIHKIGKRDGVGKLLGEGTKVIAEEIGQNAIEFAIQVKGLEAPAHDPRAKNSHALGFSTSNRGACHLQHFGYDLEDGLTMPDMGVPETLDRYEVEGKAEFVIKMQNFMSMIDSIGTCKFITLCGVSLKPLVKELELVTGFNIDAKEFLKIGERIFNLKRLYNVRCGISRKDDTLPLRLLTQKRKKGKDEDRLPPLGSMLNEYYELRCWDEIGIPTNKKIKELDIIEYI